MTERALSVPISNHDKPVFIQGLYRSRTTFLAAEFSEDVHNKLIYEPLHPNTGQNRDQEITPKRLRHPQFEKAFYAKHPENLAAPIDLGVKRYYLEPNESEPELERYLNQLIVSTEGRPVFKFVRMALRGEWVASKFPGAHIYIDRDLSALINSYYSFRGRLSWYLSEFVTIVGANADNVVFGELAQYMGLKKIEGSYHELKEYYRKLTFRKFKDEQYTKQTMVDMVAFFRELAIKQASTYADVIITPDDLREPEKRNQLAEEITQLTGTSVDFSNYKDKRPKQIVTPSENILTIIQEAQLEK